MNRPNNIQAAIDALSYQTQLDDDGVMCGVSRQALHEALDYITSLEKAAEWYLIESDSEPHTLKPVWVADEYKGHGTGQMIPAYRDIYEDWRELYTDKKITWHPTHWRPLPSPPLSKVE